MYVPLKITKMDKNPVRSNLYKNKRIKNWWNYNTMQRMCTIIQTNN